MVLLEIKDGDFVKTKSGWGVVLIENGGDKCVVYQSGGWDKIDSVLNDIKMVLRGIKCFSTAANAEKKPGEYERYFIYNYNEKPVEMTISQIEGKLGIKNLKIIKEDKE